MEEKKKKVFEPVVGRAESLCYGAGAMGSNMMTGFIAYYLTIYCTDVLLIRAALVSVILFVPSMVDAISDILLINRIDRTKSRLGTYRPWLLSVFPMGAVFLLIFWKQPFLGNEGVAVAWVLLLNLVNSAVFTTCYNASHIAMVPLMSRNSGDRLKLTRSRDFFEILSEALVTVASFKIILFFGGDHSDPRGWKFAAGIFAGLSFLLAMLCMSRCRERFAVRNEDPEGRAIPLREKLRAVAGCRSFRVLAISCLIFFIPWYNMANMASYYCIYYLGSEELVTPLCAVFAACSAVGILLVEPLARRFSRISLIRVFSAITLVMGASSFFLRSRFSFFAFCALTGCCIGGIYVLISSYLPESADEIRHSAGLDLPGMTTAAFQFMTKIGIALGTCSTGVFLALGGYDGAASVQKTSAINAIRAGLFCPLIAGLLAVVLLSGGLERRE